MKIIHFTLVASVKLYQHAYVQWNVCLSGYNLHFYHYVMNNVITIACFDVFPMKILLFM